MQKSKNKQQLKYQTLLIHASQLFLLVAMNVIIVSQNDVVINKVALIAPQLDPQRLVFIGSVFNTLIGYIIHYNLLLVIFQMAGEEIENSSVALLYFMSSLLAVSSIYALKHVWQMTYMQEAMLVTILYVMFLFIYTIIVLRKYAQKQHKKFNVPVRLLVLLLLYSIANVFLTYTGGHSYA